MARSRKAKPKPKTTRTVKTCGDFGGITADTGKPCTLPAGWGRPKRTGRCAAHDAKAEQVLAERKARYLELLSSGDTSHKTACQSIGVDMSTVWRWRAADADFDDAWRAAQAQSDGIRTTLVEDSLFARSVAGRAQAVETIFYLKTRDPKRWPNRISPTGGEGELIPIKLIRDILREDEELRAEEASDAGA